MLNNNIGYAIPVDIGGQNIVEFPIIVSNSLIGCTELGRFHTLRGLLTHTSQID